MGPGMRHRGLHRDEKVTARLKAKLLEERTEHVKSQMELFKTKLEEFATRHRNEINADPQFRQQFLRMARSIGVDPLSSSKNFWTNTLGLGTFYFDLSIQIANICMSTRPINGGIISWEELKRRILRLRGTRGGEISDEDISRALARLSELGGGYAELIIGNDQKKFVRSVPEDFETDTLQVLSSIDVSSSSGYTTLEQCAGALKWTKERALSALEKCVKLGLAWIDVSDTMETRYFFPSMFPQFAL